ncbi:MAG: PilZ domain-containing protein [Candidatus Hydrogenedentes bacterium]|nr:PilZ domain-containing protein [Candidatus Hydrogenedentota bacterium]
MNNTSSEILNTLKETLKPDTPGILVFEDYWCPISVISVTENHIRISKPLIVDKMYVGAGVALELCSSRGCLVFHTYVIEIPEMTIDGIVLDYPQDPGNIFLRKYWRLSVNLPVILKPMAHPQRLKGKILNISAGGILVETQPIEVGINTPVDIFFTLPPVGTSLKEDMQLVGSVTHIVRQEDKLKLSLKFVGMFPDDEQKINKFVVSMLRNSCPMLNILY